MESGFISLCQFTALDHGDDWPPYLMRLGSFGNVHTFDGWYVANNSFLVVYLSKEKRTREKEKREF